MVLMHHGKVLDHNQRAVIRILGPVDVLGPSGSIALGSRLEKMLLAALAVAANHAVSADQLAQILWEDTPPPSRNNTLQTYISRLRHVIGHDRIRSEDHSYELQASPDDLDALRFESLVGDAAALAGRPKPCLAACREALEIWRGAPFGDFADRDPFRLEVIRLDDLRLYVVELRLECEIALGNAQLVTGALQAMVEEYPFRERLWQLYVSALAMGRRRIEALRACNQLRSLLAEVGLEPTAEILRLEDAILIDDAESTIDDRLVALLYETGSHTAATL